MWNYRRVGHISPIFHRLQSNFASVRYGHPTRFIATRCTVRLVTWRVAAVLSNFSLGLYGTIYPDVFFEILPQLSTSKKMYTCVYIYIYVFVYVYIYIYICLISLIIHIYIYRCVQMYIYIYILCILCIYSYFVYIVILYMCVPNWFCCPRCIAAEPHSFQRRTWVLPWMEESRSHRCTCCKPQEKPIENGKFIQEDHRKWRFYGVLYGI